MMASDCFICVSLAPTNQTMLFVLSRLRFLPLSITRGIPVLRSRNSVVNFSFGSLVLFTTLFVDVSFPDRIPLISSIENDVSNS